MVIADADHDRYAAATNVIALQDAEIIRLRARLRYIGIDDPDARAALRGDPPPSDGKG